MPCTVDFLNILVISCQLIESILAEFEVLTMPKIDAAKEMGMNMKAKEVTANCQNVGSTRIK